MVLVKDSPSVRFVPLLVVRCLNCLHLIHILKPVLETVTCLSFDEDFPCLGLHPLESGAARRGGRSFGLSLAQLQAYASGAVDDLLDQRPLLAQFYKNPFRARKEFVRFVKSRMGQGKRGEFYKGKDHRFLGSEEFVEGVQERLKSVAEHFGRDPEAISQGVGKLETTLREDEKLESRITGLAEKLAKRKKRILI